MARILRRNGLVEPRRRRRLRSDNRRWERPEPMALWQLDIVGGVVIDDGHGGEVVTIQRRTSNTGTIMIARQQGSGGTRQRRAGLNGGGSSARGQPSASRRLIVCHACRMESDGAEQVMQIGAAANRVGLSLRTMRHWDDVGLAKPSARSVGGFRLYTEADLDRLLLIKTFKPLDLSLEQMRELLALMDAVAADTADAADDEGATDAVLERLAMFQAVTDSRIEALTSQTESLETLSAELRRLATHRAGARRGPATPDTESS